MTNRKKSNQSDSQEDHEYGFPFVEVVPLESKSEITQKEILESTKELTADVVEESKVTETSQSQKSEPKKIEIKKKERTFTSTEKKKSSKPIVLLLTLMILVVLGAMAYFMYYLPQQELTAQKAEIEAAQDLEDISKAQKTTEEEPIENEENNVAEIEEKEEALDPTPATPELTLIQSREASPRYFIIVGSVVAERFAKQEAQKYLDMNKNTWIIFPYGDIRNYRIAVGKFDNIKTATEAWETAKGEFGDAIWILKY